MQLNECGLWYVAVGFLVRREATPAKDKNGAVKPGGQMSYTADIMVGSSKVYLKLTDVQWASIPQEGMDARVEGELASGDGGYYMKSVNIKPHGAAVPTARRA